MARMISHLTGRIVALLVLFQISSLHAQPAADSSVIEFPITQREHKLELVVNTSRILTLDREIPRAMVNNPEVIRLVPLSPQKVQISALKTGVTQVNLWDDEGELYTISLIVMGDAQELEMLLATEFPQASLRIRPLSTSVVISGRVDRASDVSQIVRMAEDYYPTVINNITVGGVQQVMLHVQVMEVSRTKLRAMGFDWANFGNTDFFAQSVSGALGAFTPTGTATGSGGETISFGLVGPNNQFFGFLEALRDNNLAKILAEPTLVTVSGRPAAFNAGGEFPILVPQSLGTIAVEYKQFGTRVDFVPIVLGNGAIRLEVRPQVSELDNANGVTLNGNRIPALRTRWVDTAVEMKAGQTLALAGLIQMRTESQRRGLPWLGDLPWAGTLFRQTREQQNEIELVVTVRPELVDALDPHEVPACLPGQQTTSPNDVELHFRGYMEVPNCCPDGSCSSCQQGGGEYYAPQGGYPMGIETPADMSGYPAESSIPAASPAQSPDAAFPAPNDTTSFSGRPAFRQARRVSRSVRPASSRKQSEPGLFGRVGYDVLDYKE